MTTEPSSESVTRRLRLAAEMLQDAEMLFESSRLKSAADRAYYSMFHAAQAALLAVGAEATRSHRGLRSEFGKRLVKRGLIETNYAKDLSQAGDVRQISTYEAYAPLSREGVAELINKAHGFLDRVKALIGESA